MYSVISVIVDSLPGNTKKQGIDKFVSFRRCVGSDKFVPNKSIVPMFETLKMSPQVGLAVGKRDGGKPAASARAWLREANAER